MGGACMTPELIGIVAVGVALAGLMLVSNRENARALRAEMKDMREDTRKQFESMRAEMKELRGEMKAEMKDLREGTSQQFEAVHAEIKELREDTSQQFEAVRGEMAKLRERMARIEGMFEGFLRREARESEPAAGVGVRGAPVASGE